MCEVAGAEREWVVQWHLCKPLGQQNADRCSKVTMQMLSLYTWGTMSASRMSVITFTGRCFMHVSYFASASPKLSCGLANSHPDLAWTWIFPLFIQHVNHSITLTLVFAYVRFCQMKIEWRPDSLGHRILQLSSSKQASVYGSAAVSWIFLI